MQVERKQKTHPNEDKSEKPESFLAEADEFSLLCHDFFTLARGTKRKVRLGFSSNFLCETEIARLLDTRIYNHSSFFWDKNYDATAPQHKLVLIRADNWMFNHFQFGESFTLLVADYTHWPVTNTTVLSSFFILILCNHNKSLTVNFTSAHFDG